MPAPAVDRFPDALRFVLAREGGFVHHPADKGGATNQGVTQGVYDAYRRDMGRPAQSVRHIGQAEAAHIYRSRYWQASGADRLSWPLALVVFDTAVNSGPGRARELLSKSAGDVGRYLTLREQFYRAIVARDPTQAVFLRGWLNRLAHLKAAVGSALTVTVVAAVALGVYALSKRKAA